VSQHEALPLINAALTALPNMASITDSASSISAVSPSVARLLARLPATPRRAGQIVFGRAELQSSRDQSTFKASP
jgi:hypothetical protein